MISPKIRVLISFPDLFLRLWYTPDRSKFCISDSICAIIRYIYIKIIRIKIEQNCHYIFSFFHKNVECECPICCQLHILAGDSWMWMSNVQSAANFTVPKNGGIFKTILLPKWAISVNSSENQKYEQYSVYLSSQELSATKVKAQKSFNFRQTEQKRWAISSSFLKHTLSSLHLFSVKAKILFNFHQTVRIFNLILLPEGAVSQNSTENKKDRQCLPVSKTYFKFSVSLFSHKLSASKVDAQIFNSSLSISPLSAALFLSYFVSFLSTFSLSAASLFST